MNIVQFFEVMKCLYNGGGCECGNCYDLTICIELHKYLINTGVIIECDPGPY
jgi:hypothetical protein